MIADKQLTRMIEKGKPLSVIRKKVEALALAEDKRAFDVAIRGEYDVLFPAYRDMTAEEKIVHDTEVIDELETTIEREEDYEYPQVQIEYITTEEVQVQETIDGEEVQKTITQEVRTPSNYVTFTDWLNETRVITEAVEATYDEDGMVLTEAVAEVTELVRPYIANDVTALVDAYVNGIYKELRVKEYPPIADYVDAVVKDDTEAIEAYIKACLAVKAKYPKV